MGEWRARKRLILELFVLANLAFLALDIFVAHSMNGFADAIEWTPLVFSIAGSLAVACALHPRPLRAGPARQAICRLVAMLSILVGIAGMVLHLDSHFFEHQTIQNLVYTAPFAAPLAYTGLGLLLLMNHTVPDGTDEWGRWVVLLALGGFVGNFVLALCDHAQNGFFRDTEWVAVFAAAFAVGFLAVAAFGRTPRAYLRLCLVVLALEAGVGVLGFGLHVSGSLHAAGDSFFERLVFGPPVFAPLLFANLAVLGAIGIADLMGAARTARADARPSTT